MLRIIGIGCIATICLIVTVMYAISIYPQSRTLVDAHGLATVKGEIPIHPQSRTLADVHEIEAKFLHRVFTQAYLKREDRDKKHDKAMQAMLKEIEQCMLTGNEGLPLKSLWSKSMLLMRSQCNDALVGFVYGYSLEGGKSSVGETWIKRTIKALPKQGYSPYLMMRTVWMLESAYRKELDNRRSFREQGRKLLLQWLDQDPQSWQGDGLENLIPAIRHYLFPLKDTPDDFAELDQFIEALSMREIPPWLIDYAHGASALQRAWKIRGGGWSNNVREDQWNRVYEQLEIARTALHKAHAESAGREEPALDMIDVSLMAHNKDFPQDVPRYWFEQAVSRRFDSIEVYGAMANAMLPRWSGGSQEAFLAFGKECLDTKRFDTTVPYRAVMMARWIGEDAKIEGGYPQLKSLGGFELVRKTLEGYIANETDADRQRTYISELLFWCYKLDEPGYARKVYEQLDGGFDRLVLSHFRGYSWRNRVFTPAQISLFLARGGQFGPMLDRALELERLHEFDKAAKLYQQMQAQAKNDVYVSRLASQRETLVRWRNGFESGDWTPLTFNESLDGWRVSRGTWKRIDDRTVEGVTDTQGLRLFLELEVGRRFEIQGKIRFVKQVKPKFYNAGLMYINSYWNPRIHDGFLFVKDEGALKSFSGNVPARMASIDIHAEVAFKIRLADELAWVEFDGKPIYNGIWLTNDNDFVKQSQWCIGGSYMRFAGTTLRFADLEIRKVQE